MITGRYMADEHAFDFRPYTASDFEVVADPWTRVNRELAPAGMETLFEQYIATTIARESFRLCAISSPWRAEMPCGGSSQYTTADGSSARSASSVTIATRPSSAACT